MYHCDVIFPDRLDAETRRDWIELARVAGLTSPLLHPDFVQLVAASRSDVRIALFRREGQLSAVFAFHRRPGGLARPLGAPFADIQALIAAPDFDLPAPDWLGMAGIRAIHFDAVADPGGHFPALASAEPLHALVVDGDLEAVLEGQRARHAKRFKNHRRLARQLERDRGAVRLAAPDDDAAAFRVLLDWKRDQFARTGRHDVLSPAWTQSLLERAFTHPGGDIQGLMLTLRVDNRPVAGLFGIRAGGVYNPWIAAFDPEYAAYSPGQLLLHAAMEAMPALGLTRIDLAGGHDHYKKYYANTVQPMRAGMVCAGGLARARTGLAHLPWTIGQALPSALSHQVEKIHRRADLIASAELDWRGRVHGALKAVVSRRPASQGGTS